LASVVAVSSGKRGMSRILYVGTCGSQQPARATWPFAAALIAVETGDEPQILLRADATLLVKGSVAQRVRADEWPALADLLERVVAHEIPIYA
jgi:predicted peroxiredoxin